MIGGNDMSRFYNNGLLDINYEKRLLHRTDISDKKDSRLVVFGDSFFQYSTGTVNHIPNQGLSWTDLLAERLDKSILSYANAGTSLNYSVQMLFHYMKTEYDENDTIIFGVTSMTRTPNLLDDNHRGWHSKVWRFIESGNSLNNLTEEQYKYFEKDKVFWETYSLRCIYADDIKNQLRLVETYLNSIKNDVLVLHSFNHFFDGDEFNLMQIALRENRKYFDKLNHLSDPNKKLLARQAHKYFMEIGQNKKNPFDIEKYVIESR